MTRREARGLLRYQRRAHRYLCYRHIWFLENEIYGRERFTHAPHCEACLRDRHPWWNEWNVL